MKQTEEKVDSGVQDDSLETIFPVITAEEIRPLLHTGNKYLLGIQASEYFKDYAFVWYITDISNNYIEGDPDSSHVIGYAKTFESATEIYRTLDIDITKLVYTSRWVTSKGNRRRFYSIFKRLPSNHSLVYKEYDSMPIEMQMRLNIEEDTDRVMRFYEKTFTEIELENNYLKVVTKQKRNAQNKKIYKTYKSTDISNI